MKLNSKLAAAALFCLMGVTAQADTFTLYLDVVFPGFALTKPTSTTVPWLSATFTDVNTNDVKLTMKAENLSENTARATSTTAAGVVETRSENVVSWWFNIDPTMSARGGAGANARLSITHLAGIAAVDVNQSGGTGQNGFKADADGWYDFAFVFATGTASSAFTDGETSVYDLKGVNGQVIEAADFFNFFSNPTNVNGGGTSPNGTYESAAHIRNTKNPDGKKGPYFDDAWIGAVPEPGAWILLGTVAIPILVRLSRRHA